MISHAPSTEDLYAGQRAGWHGPTGKKKSGKFRHSAENFLPPWRGRPVAVLAVRSWVGRTSGRCHLTPRRRQLSVRLGSVNRRHR